MALMASSNIKTDQSLSLRRVKKAMMIAKHPDDSCVSFWMTYGLWASCIVFLNQNKDWRMRLVDPENFNLQGLL